MRDKISALVHGNQLPFQRVFALMMNRGQDGPLCVNWQRKTLGPECACNLLPKLV